MAKATKKKEAKVKELVQEQNLLTTEELQSVKNHMAELEKLKGAIGDLETQKGITMANYMSVATSFKQVQVKLEEKYGSISVDTVTGEYKLVEKEDGAN